MLSSNLISDNLDSSMNSSVASRIHYKPAKLHRATGVGSAIVNILMGATEFFNDGHYTDYYRLNQINQTIVLEERVRTKISLIEARVLAINKMVEYDSNWKQYLKEEGNILFEDNF